jgi:hypothetical protein
MTREAEYARGFLPFPSIGKFKDMLKELPWVFGGGDAVPPFVTFNGTVKLHGTHADLVCRGSGGGSDEITLQSRNRVITTESDNQDCARFFEERKARIRPLFDMVRERLCDGRESATTITISGEYCGRGIQSKVALCSLPKMFVVFAVKVGHTWLHAGTPGFADVCDEQHGIFNIARSRTYTLQVDTSAPDPALERAMALTEDVDAECPFAKGLGVTGPGEGIVWTCAECPASERLWFKTKGSSHLTPIVKQQQQQQQQLHSNVSTEIVQMLLTEQRLAQGVEYLREMGHPVEMRSTKEFTAWVVGDVFKEERDAIAASGMKDALVRKAVVNAAAAWLKSNSSCGRI